MAEGLIPSTKWKAQVRDEVWRPGDTINAAIGQGYVLTSPLQLAVMTARIASGRAVKPRLIKSVDGVEVGVHRLDHGVGDDSRHVVGVEGGLER